MQLDAIQIKIKANTDIFDRTDFVVCACGTCLQISMQHAFISTISCLGMGMYALPLQWSDPSQDTNILGFTPRAYQLLLAQTAALRREQGEIDM